MSAVDQHRHAVCSAEHAGWLTLPLRRLVMEPKRILRGLVRAGDHAVDLGCGPGYFTVPMAEMVGPTGRVTAVDLQPDMLRLAEERAARRGVAARVRMQTCPPDSIGTVDPADFVLAFWMVHETPDAGHVLCEVRDALKPSGRFLLVEPRGHVSAAAWDRTLELAGRGGLRTVARPRVFSSRAVLLAGG